MLYGPCRSCCGPSPSPAHAVVVNPEHTTLKQTSHLRSRLTGDALRPRSLLLRLRLLSRPLLTLRLGLRSRAGLRPLSLRGLLLRLLLRLRPLLRSLSRSLSRSRSLHIVSSNHGSKVSTSRCGGSCCGCGPCCGPCHSPSHAHAPCSTSEYKHMQPNE
jgi:hypothetical protein